MDDFKAACNAEEWRPVVGYANYQASSKGRIRNVITGRTLTAYQVTDGYFAVTVYNQTRHVHSLVARAFLGPRPPKHDVNHIDAVKSNNTPCNLEYLTRKDHMAHGVRMGLHTGKPRGRLSHEDIPLIREQIKIMTYEALAKKYGVCKTTIWRAATGSSWA